MSLKCSICFEPNTYMALVDDCYMCGNCEILPDPERFARLVDATLVNIARKWGS